MRVWILLLAAAAGCGEGVTRFEVVPAGNPLVPEIGAYPFPSDYYTVADDSTRTGRRVAMDPEILPNLVTPEIFENQDGFSRMPSILAYLPGGIDSATLPPRDDLGASLSPDASVMLINTTTWEQVPILVENDLTEPDPALRSLMIRPLRLLDPGTGHVVLLRDSLRAVDGNAFEANEFFVALRDGKKTKEPKLESQRADFDLVLEAMERFGLGNNSVVLGWTFHTRSEEQVVGDLLAMQAITNTTTLGSYQVVSDDVVDADGRTNRQIVLEFEAPSFIGLDRTLNRDPEGNPVQLGERTITFGLTIPSTVTEPRPVILYGHGFFGSWRQGTRGDINAVATDRMFTTLSTNIGFNEDNAGDLLGAVIGQPERLDEVVANVLQNIVNFTSLTRLVEEQLATDITLDTMSGPVPLLDPNEIHYTGISNGGTFGFLVAATHPRLERASMIVGGGGLSHFLERAVQWNQFGAALALVYPDIIDRKLLISMFQATLDPADPINYAEHLVTGRFPGNQPLTAALQMAVHDSQVRNILTEWTARTAGIPLITPSPIEVFGLDTVDITTEDVSGLNGALFVYDENVEPSPTTNLPPAVDNGTHQTVRGLANFQEQWGTFLMTGEFTQPCTGACDPD